MLRQWVALTEPGESGNEDHDEFSLPTGSGFAENALEVSARRFISDPEFGIGGPKCSSCNEVKC